jgi:glycosyltransferase involved in cell wall biosynthesis
MDIITFIFPHPVDGPTGGYKVVYEYANRLVADGYRVNIVYSGSLFWMKKSLYFKLTNCVRYVQRLIKGYGGRRWFDLDERVKEHFTFSLNYRHVPKSDIYVATSPYTAMYVKDYPTDKKIYFIQGYENWGAVTDEILLSTYQYPLKKITVANWLKEIIEGVGEKCEVIPNGFDFNYFRYAKPIDERDKFTIVMLYHTAELKGCKYGFEALELVKQRYPQLRVTLFGTPERPTNLPEWYEYYQRPDRETHNRIYNEAAIFLGTSNIEGWGLTVGEAMMCGAAVVCTDNKGYMEMAVHGENALVSPVRDARGLADNMIRLIEDDELRCRLATNALAHIKQFTWDRAYGKLLEVFFDIKK